MKKGGIYILKKILLQQYYIKKIIGNGGIGIVYLAEHMTLHYKCVIKCIRKSQKSYVNFYYEANILKNLKNPIIPSLYDIQEDEKYYYLIEEFFSGKSLFSYNLQKKISNSEIISIIFQLCEVLEYLHMQEPEAILYLDLQPKNILIEKGKIKLIDFGSARKQSDLNNQKFFYGTPGFAAPEQYQGGLLSESTDIYSLGAVFYFLLTKLIPSNSTKLTELPNKYKNVIKKCLYYHPEERYQSILEVKKEIKQILSTDKKGDFPFILSIAGTKSGIGVTHISFAFAKYLSKRQSCFYVEKNSSEAMKHFIQQEKLKKKNNGYFYEGFYLIDNVKEDKTLPNNSIIIKDYGVLTIENKKEFQKEEHKIIVMGIKPWENSEELLNLNLEEVLYLINLCDGSQFYEWQKKTKKGYRVPYMPNPFCTDHSEFWEEVYKKIKNNIKEK